MIAALYLYFVLHIAMGSWMADEVDDECFTDACVGCIDDCTQPADEGEEE